MFAPSAIGGGELLSTIILLAIIFTILGAVMRRSTYIRVHNFEYKDVPLPSLVERTADEHTLAHARSFSDRMQLFVTTRRILVFNKTLFGSQHYARYFPTDNLSSAQVGYRNPFGLLIFAALVVLIALIQFSNSSRGYYGRPDSSILVVAFIIAAVLVAFWYYLRSYVIVLKNQTATYTVLSRSAADLSKILGLIDSIRIK